MATVSIDIPTGVVNDVKAAFNLTDKTNAEALVLLKQHLAEYVKLRVRQYKQTQASQDAVNAVTDVIIT